MEVLRTICLALATIGGAFLLLFLVARGGRALVRRRITRQSPSVALRADELLLKEAEVTVPVAPGMLGKAAIQWCGAPVEVPIRAADPAQAFARGGRVRFIDYSDDYYLVEPAEEEHQVR